MAVTLAQLETLYLAYFGRPADFDGVQFYSTGAQSLDDVGAAFANSAESRALYGSGYGSAFVNAIYNNLFGRDAEAAGLSYWVGQLATGAVSPAAAALAILQAAQGDDAQAIRNKLAAATRFTQGLDNPLDILAYQGSVAAAAARAWLLGVDGDAATLAGALAGLPALVARIERVGGEVGRDWLLTAGIDTFTMPVATLVDTVRGVVDFSGGKDASTFSALDTIAGNGRTVVEVFLKDTTGGVADRMSLSHIGQLNFTNLSAANPNLLIDASTWQDVASLSLAGQDGIRVTVDNLVNAGPRLRLRVDGGTVGTVKAEDATVGGFEVQAAVENTLAGPVDAYASLGLDGVTLTLGEAGSANLKLLQRQTSSVADVTLGDYRIGDVDLQVGASGHLDMQLQNQARANGHAATAGGLAVGDIHLAAGANASPVVALFDTAFGLFNTGATVGDVELGDNLITAATGASAPLYLYHQATAVLGDASLGKLVVGDIGLEGVGSVQHVFYNNARVVGTGAATAGDVTLGDVSIAATSASGSKLAAYYLDATSVGATARVGDIAAGDITVGGAGSNGVYFYNCAAAGTGAHSGDAVTGSVRLGDVCLVATGTGTNILNAFNSAHDDLQGTARVGDVVLGDVRLCVASSSNYLTLGNSAFARHGDAIVGNISVGDIQLSQAVGDSGLNYVLAKASAAALTQDATTGRVSIGDVGINALGITQAAAMNEVILYNSAVATLGAASAGGIAVGDVMARTGSDGYAYLALHNIGSGTADGRNGSVTIGNVAMEGSAGAYLIVAVENLQRKDGSVGGVTVGDVSLAADLACAYATLTVENRAGAVGDAGDIRIGDISLQGATFSLSVDNRAAAGDVGSITVGDVSLAGSAGPHHAIINQATNGNAGRVEVGDIRMADQAGQGSTLAVSNLAQAGREEGVLVGDVRLELSNRDAGGLSNQLTFSVLTDSKGTSRGGDIVTGDIRVATAGVSSKGAFTGVLMSAVVNLTATDGNVTVGNIVVSGGVQDSKGHLSDKLDVLGAWLMPIAGPAGHITVGNIDYSAYAAAAILDVHDWSGAAVISGSRGGGTITDNKGGNAIVLNAAAQADVVHFQAVQAGVADAGGAVTAAQATLDSITGFASGDRFDVAGGIQGNGSLIQGTPAQTFAQFLVHAENQITKSGNSAYVAVIAGDTYVALNTGGKVGEIVKLTGVHSFSWDTGALVFAT